MGEIDWGVPVQRTRKQEKFNNPVVTMSAVKEGGARKFTFNTAAAELLGLVKPGEGLGESFVTFGKVGATGQVAIMSATEENPQYNMHKTNKSYAFSNKKVYEWIASLLDLDTTVENYLHIAKAEEGSHFLVERVTVDVENLDTISLAEVLPEEESNSEPVHMAVVEDEEELETVEDTSDWNH